MTACDGRPLIDPQDALLSDLPGVSPHDTASCKLQLKGQSGFADSSLASLAALACSSGSFFLLAQNTMRRLQGKAV
jgi:hypothetical protein